ncbi:unnamed protein product, partial [Mesorhabditis belari]|uniref:Uncharacterized protein n=1 Tax=Mesorhabditis belari TaxID=2138241 RepID=A0AAF3J3N9_9BILA
MLYAYSFTVYYRLSISLPFHQVKYFNKFVWLAYPFAYATGPIVFIVNAINYFDDIKDTTRRYVSYLSTPTRDWLH